MSQGPLSGSTSALAQSLALDTVPWSKDPTTQGVTRLSCLWGLGRKRILLSTVSSSCAPGQCRATLSRIHACNVPLMEKRRRQRVREAQLTVTRGQREETKPSDFKAQAGEYRAAPLRP